MKLMNAVPRSLFYLLILLVIGVGGAMAFQTEAAAQGEAGSTRQTEIVASVTEYQWWLVRWSTNEIACVVGVEYEGLPDNLDVLLDCGETVYDEWVNTQPCSAAAAENGNTSSCEGLYIFRAGQQTVEKTVTVDLPLPEVWLSLSGCTPQPPLNRCDRLPTLVFTGEEPLPNEAILAIHILVGDRIVDCAGPICELPLEATSVEGQEIEFWADSTFGDESEHFIARIRVVDAGVPVEPGTGNWYIDIISSQWRGHDFSSCAAMWEAFPQIGGEPQWLTTPPDYTGLASDTGFVYLAGELIRTGLVDAGFCPNVGLLGNGAANQCGLEAARSLVNNWQDQFDQNIFEAARENNLPAQLLKNLFAQESQFWPGQTTEREYGLGQLTDQGADTTLLWNIEFYSQFCPLVLSEDACSKGYAFIGAENQELLRGALASKSGALCENCATGVDLAHAQTTIDLFAETVVANCSQVAFLVSDITGEMPGEVSSYEDLWRFTLANYNAGPLCVARSMNNAWAQYRRLDWETVSSRFPNACSKAIQYVDRVTRDRLPTDPDFLPSPTPTRTPLPATPPAVPPTATPASPNNYPPPPTSTPASYPPPQPTSTPVGYPPPQPTSTPVGYP